MRYRLRTLLIVLACVALAVCLIPQPARPEKIALETYWAFGSGALAAGLLIDLLLSMTYRTAH